MLVEHVGEVHDIERQLHLTDALDVINVLSNMEVDLILPRSHVGVALSILATMILGIVIILNPLLKHLTALLGSELLRIGELHLCQLLLRRNIEQTVAAPTIIVVVSLLVHRQRIAATTETIVVDGNIRAHPTIPIFR